MKVHRWRYGRLPPKTPAPHSKRIFMLRTSLRTGLDKRDDLLGRTGDVGRRRSRGEGGGNKTKRNPAAYLLRNKMNSPIEGRKQKE